MRLGGSAGLHVTTDWDCIALDWVGVGEGYLRRGSRGYGFFASLSLGLG
jgi:hypothetical protein